MLKEVATNLSHCCSTLKYRASKEIFSWLLVSKRLILPRDMHFLIAAYILRVNIRECMTTGIGKILRSGLYGRCCKKCEYTQCYSHRGSGQMLNCRGCYKNVCRDKCYKGGVCAHHSDPKILCSDCDLCMECRIDADGKRTF